MSFRQVLFAVLVLTVLASCAVFEPTKSTGPDLKEHSPDPLPPSTRPTYNLSGYPGAMKDGYIDGCETAKKTYYAQKDVTRYTTDGQYRMGWDDGFDLCREDDD